MHELQQYLVDEFVEGYEQGRLTRRQALKLIAGLTGATLAAQMLEAPSQQAAEAVAATPPGVSIYRVAPDMKQNGKTFRAIVYPDADHGFHDDTGDRYNAAAAKAAREETLAWFGQYLQSA
jgi:dienelactone hydrolase